MPRASDFRAVALLMAVVLVAAVCAVWAPAAWAAFTGRASGAASSFGTAACFSDGLNGVQSGTAVSAANGPLHVDIAPADPARSVLLFSTSSSSDTPDGVAVRGTMESATRLRFDRVTSETTPAGIGISWYVAAYDCGVRVQRGQTLVDASTVEVPITPVSAVGQAFVTTSYTGTEYGFGSTWNSNDNIAADLSSATTLTLRDEGPFQSGFDRLVAWQVVELSPALGSVVRASTSLTDTALTATATLPSPVDPARTLLLGSWTASNAGTGADPQVGTRLLQPRLTSSTQVTFTRSATTTGQTIPLATAVAVQFTGATVQTGSAGFPAGTSSVTAPLTAIDTTRTVALATGMNGGGVSSGQSSYVADDVPGVATTTVTLPSTTAVQLQRRSTAGPADITWQVLQLPRGSTSNPAANADLVVNPGFETGTLSGWTCSHSQVVTTPRYSGSYALRAATTSGQSASCSQTITVTPNTNYSLSAWLHGTGTLSYELHGELPVVGLESGSSSDWQRLAPPTFHSGTSTSITIWLDTGTASSAVAHFDDVLLGQVDTEIAPPPDTSPDPP